jgi:hypothetical protein
VSKSKRKSFNRVHETLSEACSSFLYRCEPIYITLNSLNKYIALLISSFYLGGPAHAQVPPSAILSPVQLSIIAKGSVQHELNILNDALKNNITEVEGYSSGKIKELLKGNIRKISAEYAFNKCMFDSENIQTLLSDELTLAHDDLISRSQNLEDLRDSYGTRIWKLISQLCVKSQKHFESRLQTLTSKGNPLLIDETTAQKISKIYFYPTVVGKPSLKKSLIRTLYATIDVAYSIGSIQSLVGIVVGDIIVSIAFISQSMMNFMLVDLSPMKIKMFSLDAQAIPSDLELDFNVEECKFLTNLIR